VQDYPDYYELVKTPMDLATLLSRVKRFHYRDHREFLRDLALISKCVDSIDGIDVWHDACPSPI
jgi:hypothetical protein